MADTRMLGIDPGLRICGYGCVVLSDAGARPRALEAGTIRLRQGDSLSSRLAELFAQVTAVIEELKPDAVAVESVFSHSRQVRTAIIMGHGRGVILLAAERAGCELVELAPAEVKKSVTGNGRASKVQVQHAVASTLSLDMLPEPPDVADALAVAITAALRRQRVMLGK